MLTQGWSPELIAGRIKKHHRDLPSISPEAIYQWIYAQRPDLIHSLVRSHPKRWPKHYSRRRRMAIPGRVSIQERPLEAQSRQQGGHWETDLVVGRGSSALQVLVDRKHRFSRLRKSRQRPRRAPELP